MTSPVLTKYHTYLVIALVALFTIFAFWIRMIPAMQIGGQDILSFVGSDDPLYNLRQVELMLANFPSYAWWEPMTLFPYGTDLYWGPLTTYIAATLCLVTGAATRPEIIFASLAVPPLMGAAMVPVMFLLGRRVSDWKGGLVAAGLIAVIAGQYFFRSLFGYFDHHMTETLTSTIFCLVYIVVVRYALDHEVSLASTESLKRPALLAAGAGVAYFIGLVAMPTMILFAMIVAIYTLAQFLYDVYRGRSSDALLVINGVTFAVALVLLLAFGLKNTGIDLSAYTVGHVIAYLGVIGGTAILWGLARYLRGRPWYYFPAALAGVGVVIGIILFVALPDVYNILIGSFGAFFGQYDVTNTVQEARGWSIESAWSTFQFGLVLMLGGFAVLVFRFWREHRADHLFVFVWSAIILLSTVQHVRYEYYLAVNIALLAGIVISFAFELGGADLAGLLGLGQKRARPAPAPAPEPERKTGKKGGKKAVSAKPPTGKQRALAPRRSYSMAGAAAVLALVLITIPFVYLSLVPIDLDKNGEYDISTSLGTANLQVNKMNPNWKESLEWMKNGTPATGMDMKKVYDKQGFTYPAQAYGVMSWWDYGHMITYIAERIPNANPFQQGVAGPDGSAAYFISTNATESDRILDVKETRYVVTDIEMAVTKFWAMATWYNSTAGQAPYQPTMYTRSQQNTNVLEPVTVYLPAYYQTTIAKLQIFDGSETAPGTAYYIEYQDTSKSKTAYPLITGVKSVNATDAVQQAAAYNARAAAGTHATAAGVSPDQPTETVPALSHYRLVHESPTGTSATIKYVKVFEYVKGARLRGEGTIEVPVVTNTGRNFTWRATAVNGEFVLPYATGGSADGVRTTGPYVLSSGQTVEVSEAAVQSGSAL